MDPEWINDKDLIKRGRHRSRSTLSTTEIFTEQVMHYQSGSLFSVYLDAAYPGVAVRAGKIHNWRIGGVPRIRTCTPETGPRLIALTSPF